MTLRFENVPHWGWRARHNGRVFEIERLGTDAALRYLAYERKPGVVKPLAQAPFANAIAARLWLDQRARA